MATIFTVNYDGDYGDKYELKLEAYEDSISTTANTSKVTAYLYLRRTDSSSSGAYNNDGTPWTITIDGTQYSGNSTWDTRNSTGFKLIGSASKTITHNSDGSKSISMSGTHVGNSASGSSKMGNASGTGTFKLTDIPRYANFTVQQIDSKGLNWIKVKWATDKEINSTQYSLNGGPWTNLDNWSNTGSTFTISNLEPNTSYSIRIRVNVNGLDTISNELTTSTYDIGKISSISNFEHGGSTSISITNPSGSTLNLVMKIGSTQIFSRSVNKDTRTITFSDAELDTIYKLYGRNSSLTATFTLTTENTYTNSKTCTITFKRKSENCTR